MTDLSRRGLLRAAGYSLAASTVPFSGLHAQSKDRITVASYGGIFETTLRKTFIADYTKATGVGVDVQLGSPDLWISQVQASRGKPPLDVVLSSGAVIIDAGPSGIFDTISAANVPNFADVPSSFNDPCKGWAVAFNYGTAGIVYHKGRVKNPPKSIREFVDRTIKGEWTASLSNAAYQSGLGNLMWSINDVFGGTVENITPVIEAVKKMKPHSIFWSNVNDFLNHLTSGEADIGIYHDGRTWAHYDAGHTWIDFVNPTEGAVANPIYAAKPKGASENAWKFINQMLEPSSQAQFAEIMNYPMTNRKTVYSDKVKRRIVPLDKVRLLPVETMGKHLSEWVERWNKEIRA